MRRRIAIPIALAAGVALTACGRGEDRPRAVSDTRTDTGGGARSGTESGAHGGSPTGTGPVVASGAHGGSVSGSVSGTVPGPAGFPVPPFRRSEADTATSVEIVDFDYRFTATTLDGPRLYLTLRNVGDLEHRFAIYRRGAIEPVAEWPPLAAGGYAEVGVELRPGAYVAKCMLAYGYQTHAARGELQEFTVR